MIREHAILLVAWIQFFNSLFWDGMILGRVGYWFETHLHWLWKPLMGCSICMTPWHGLLAWYIFDLEPVAILLAAGINVVIVLWSNKSSG